jgi:photosystem II stability/assembly factor-like uncharacterized protein
MTNRTTTGVTGRFGRLFSTVALVGLVSAASCESCDGGSGRGSSSGGGGGGTSSWLVGRGGLMLNLDEHGRMGRYPLETRGDLLSIACWGSSRAWVAGDQGLLMTTEDAGVTWRSVDVGGKTRLRAVAIAEKGRVFVAGEEGLFRVTADAGLTWQTVPAPAVVWTSVAARHDGSQALLTTAGGDIYRYDGQALSLVAAKPARGLESITLSQDGLVAVAVGEGGAMLVSTDGGQRWFDRPSGTTRTLRDVWLIGADGKSVYAVGDGGVLVRGWTETSDGATPRSLGEGLVLRGLHLEASGHGAIVGDHGSMFVTHDFGDTWAPVQTGEARDIFAVDALGADHQHL